MLILLKMNKNELVKSLDNVKVVLGNGFDLCCGLHTRYSDYYCKHWRKYIFLKKLYKSFVGLGPLIDKKDERLKGINIWDVFFTINSSDNPKDNMKDWCDIEYLIKTSLYDSEKEKDPSKFLLNMLFSSINWHLVKKIYGLNDEYERNAQGFVAFFVKYKMEQLKWIKGSFFEFLLMQLKEFEKDFGKFIYQQIHLERIEQIRFGIEIPNDLYISKANHILNQLCNLDTASIDTFNYSLIEDDSILPKLSHINGSWEEPIFGIDTFLQPDKAEYIFTKTNRRMESDIKDIDYHEKADFKHLVIFGHSLNEADYSYFFPIFDKLKVLESNAQGLLIFAYYVWDKNKEEEITSNLRSKISKMIYKYAEESGVNNPNRFLDTLSTRGRIVIYEIEDFPISLKHLKNTLDAEWEQIYKEVSSLEEMESI